MDGLTPCHATALGYRKYSKIPNQLQGSLHLCLKSLRNILTFQFYDSYCRRRCLEYLVQYGGDLQKHTYQDESTKDIAQRRKKKAIVNMINEYCE